MVINDLSNTDGSVFVDGCNNLLLLSTSNSPIWPVNVQPLRPTMEDKRKRNEKKIESVQVKYKLQSSKL